jgi:hypothetical protein
MKFVEGRILYTSNHGSEYSYTKTDELQRVAGKSGTSTGAELQCDIYTQSDGRQGWGIELDLKFNLKKSLAPN